MDTDCRLHSKLDFEDYNIKVTEMPKMKNEGESWWDEVKTINIDGNKTEIYADTTWGEYGYFKFNKNWYKVAISGVEEMDHLEEFTMCYY